MKRAAKPKVAKKAKRKNHTNSAADTAITKSMVGQGLGRREIYGDMVASRRNGKTPWALRGVGKVAVRLRKGRERRMAGQAGSDPLEPRL